MRNKLSKRPVPTGYNSRLFTIQCSSIGSLGPAQATWLEPQFLKSLKGGRTSGRHYPLCYSSLNCRQWSCVRSLSNGDGCSLFFGRLRRRRIASLSEQYCKSSTVDGFDLLPVEKQNARKKRSDASLQGGQRGEGANPHRFRPTANYSTANLSGCS